MQEVGNGSVVDRHRFEAHPDPTFHVDADPGPDPDPDAAPDPDPSFTRVGRTKICLLFTECQLVFVFQRHWCHNFQHIGQ